MDISTEAGGVAQSVGTEPNHPSYTTTPSTPADCHQECGQILHFTNAPCNHQTSLHRLTKVPRPQHRAPRSNFHYLHVLAPSPPYTLLAPSILARALHRCTRYKHPTTNIAHRTLFPSSSLERKQRADVRPERTPYLPSYSSCKMRIAASGSDRVFTGKLLL